MKLIAIKDFRNVQLLRLKSDDGDSLVKDAIHADHVHKGAVFDIGAGKDLDALKKSDRPTAELVAQLIVAGVVAEANDEKAVKAVKEEIALEEKRAKNAAAVNLNASLAAAGSAVIDALKQSPPKK